MGKSKLEAARDAFVLETISERPFGLSEATEKYIFELEMAVSILRAEVSPPMDDFRVDLYPKIREPEYALGYLAACKEEGPDVFAQGVKEVYRALRVEDGDGVE